MRSPHSGTVDGLVPGIGLGAPRPSLWILTDWQTVEVPTDD